MSSEANADRVLGIVWAKSLNEVRQGIQVVRRGEGVRAWGFSKVGIIRVGGCDKRTKR